MQLLQILHFQSLRFARIPSISQWTYDAGASLDTENSGYQQWQENTDLSADFCISRALYEVRVEVRGLFVVVAV